MNVDSVLPQAEEKPRFVNDMFARIAPTYDLMNRLMTLGQDQRWRHELLDLCNLSPRASLLDVGTGTGDIGYAAMARFPTLHAYGVDFTYEMMAADLHSTQGPCLPFAQADAYQLPFPTGSMDAVASGFLVRNMVDRTAAFSEMARVTKPGGRVVCLETTPPTDTLIGQGARFHFNTIVPFLGQVIGGDRKAYTYLNQSTAHFVDPEELKRMMEQAGLRNVVYRLRMLGTVAIHVGTR